MARYSTFKYGAQKYGTSPTTDNLLWRALVGWGGFFDSVASGRLVDIYIERGRDSFLGQVGQGWERYKPGQATITLDNEDGRYDAYNTSSPLYPNVAPGGFARISVKDGNTGTEYELFRGQVEDIRPIRSGPRKLVKILARDALQWTNNRITRSGIFSSTQLDDVQDFIVQQGQSWPFDEWALFTASTTQTAPYVWFWARNIFRAIHELEDAEIGACFHGRGGAFEFISRDTTHRTVTAIDESQVLRDIDYPQPWDIVRNRVELKWHGLKSATNQTIWELNQAIPLAAGESVDIEPIFSYQGGPSAANNINIEDGIITNTAEDGSGSSITRSVDYNTTVSGGVKLRVTNTDTSSGYITNTSYITGDPIFDAYSTIAVAEDVTSQDTYGIRVMSIDSPWVQQEADAREYVQFVLSNLKNPRIFPTIKVQNRPTLQFPIDLYVDAIDFTAATLGIDDRFRVGKIIHQWLNENGQSVLTTFKLEPYFV